MSVFSDIIRNFVAKIKRVHMEVKSKNSERYFKELLERIRDIRSSERSAIAKIGDVLATAVDYNIKDAQSFLSRYAKALNSYQLETRFANLLMLRAESWAMNQKTMTMGDIEVLAHGFVHDSSYKQDIYDNPSYQGGYVESEEGIEPTVLLPQELKDFKGSNMVLKIEDLDRLIDTFSSLNTYYRRAYAILADLDKEIMGCMETGEFPSWIDVEYKDFGFAMFEFSHFEVDLREPDATYRTLYVVYRYDTTVS